jgi:hypothetical protein
MTKLVICLLLALALTAALAMETPSPAREAADGPRIVHDVYFALKDSTPEARVKLVAACEKYLTKHDGEVFFAAGVLAEELNREVNVRDWDVGLHIVFKNKAAHDKYQDHPRHLQFIAENKDNWKKVRVFDTQAD